MENRSHALMAGIFTLVLLAAAALVAVWIGRDRTQLQPYEIISATAVSGLNPQSTVRYQGVPVGKVQSLALNPDKPGQVRIRIGVAPNTPITESTWAELGVQGVTGMSNVELRDDGTSTRRLASSAAMPATIPLRPGFFQRFEQRGGEILHNVEQVSARLERLLSNENVQATTATLQNIAAITTDLRQAATDPATDGQARALALTALSSATGPGALDRAIDAFASVDVSKGNVPGPLDSAWRQFVSLPSHAQELTRLRELVRATDSSKQILGYAVLLQLAAEPVAGRGRGAGGGRGGRGQSAAAAEAARAEARKEIAGRQ